MRYNIDNINYVITGHDQKIINIDMVSVPSLNTVQPKRYCKTFVTDEGKDIISSFTEEYNTHRLKILSSDMKTYRTFNTLSTIYSLFDVKDVAIKSSYFKPRRVTEEMLSSENDIMYSSNLIDHFNSHISADPLEFCQLKYGAYGLALEDRQFPALKKTNLIDTRYDRLVKGECYLDWFFKLSSDENSTFTYIPLSDLVLNHRPDDPLSTYINPDGYYFVAKSYGSLSNDILSLFFIERYDHKVVEANQIFNIHVDEGSGTKVIFNDFNNGIIRGETFLGKNDFDAEFSMNMNNVEEIKHARNYIGLGNVGNKLFLKYYDEIDYSPSSSIHINPDDVDDDTRIIFKAAYIENGNLVMVDLVNPIFSYVTNEDSGQLDTIEGI